MPVKGAISTGSAAAGAIASPACSGE